MVQWSLLSEIASQGVAFLSISPLHLCLSHGVFSVVINQKQSAPPWSALYQCLVAHTSGHLVGQRAHEATWKTQLQLRECVRLYHKICFCWAQGSGLSSWSGIQSRKKLGPWATNSYSMGTSAGQHETSQTSEPCSPRERYNASLEAEDWRYNLIFKMVTTELFFNDSCFQSVLIVTNISALFLLYITLKLKPFTKCSEQYLWICGYQWQDWCCTYPLLKS